MFYGEFDSIETVYEMFEIWEKDIPGKVIFAAWFLIDHYDVGPACVIFTGNNDELFIVKADYSDQDPLKDQWQPKLIEPTELFLELKKADGLFFNLPLKFFEFSSKEIQSIKCSIVEAILENLPKEHQNEIIWNLDAYVK